MDTAARATLLTGCCASVSSLMRRGAKPGGGSDGGHLCDAFRALRRAVLRVPDWDALPPLDWLAPFLAVVRSDETSGPVTGAALGALYALLTAGAVPPTAPGAAAAMAALVEAVTHCRFEATEAGHDEAVLASICDVLLAALRCPAGASLPDEAVCAAVQAAYHIGHQSGREGPLLASVSRRALRDIAAHVFAATASPRGSTAAHGLPACCEVFAFACSLASAAGGDAGAGGDGAQQPAAPPGAPPPLSPAAAAARDELRLTGLSLASAVRASIPSRRAGDAGRATKPPLGTVLLVLRRIG